MEDSFTMPMNCFASTLSGSSWLLHFTFIDFCRIDLFFYEEKQREIVLRMALQMEIEEEEPPAKKTEVGGKRKFQDIYQ